MYNNVQFNGSIIKTLVNLSQKQVTLVAFGYHAQATTIFLSGGLGGGDGRAWDFLEKNILMSQLTEKKFRFYIVAEIFFMRSPDRKKNIALLNLSSQCIVFMEKCISVPHDRKTIFAFLLMRKKYFDRKVLKFFLRAQIGS